MTLKLSLTVQPFSSTVKKNTCSRRVKYDSPTFLSQSWTLFDRASKQAYISLQNLFSTPIPYCAQFWGMEH